MEKLEIDKNYSINLEEFNVEKLVLPYEEKIKFNNLGSKGKLSRLSYLKFVESRMLELKSIVEQSKYLRLLKDTNGFHIRYELDLEGEELENELTIVDYLKIKYPIILNEEVNTGMSGDVNRVVITKGKLTE